MIPLCHIRFCTHRFWGLGGDILVVVVGEVSLCLPQRASMYITYHKYSSLVVQFISHIGGLVYLWLLGALWRLSNEVSMLTTSVWGVSGEISILIPLELKRFSPKFKPQSYPAHLPLVATMSYLHGVLPSLVCLRKYLNYESLLPLTD